MGYPTQNKECSFSHKHATKTEKLICSNSQSLIHLERMAEGLEGKLGRRNEQFKSEGERRVARTLDQYGIPYIYEQPVRIKVNEKIRNFRPDFYLPQHNVYIEYYGRAGNNDYDLRTRTKQTAYAANNLNVISIYPWTLCENWPKYLLDRLPPAATSSQTYHHVQSYNNQIHFRKPDRGYNKTQLYPRGGTR